MPELPEVETIARGVDRRVRGRVIRAVWLGGKPEPFRSPPAAIEAMLTGSRILRVRRVGKQMAVDLEREDGRPGQWLVHLGMTGRLLVADPGAEVAKHTHAVITLDDGRELRFEDPRRFGRLSVVEGDAFAGPGKEPLGISAEEFRALFRGRKTPIKSALLNQKLLHGVGNIYADESLFRAGIRPLRQAGRLTAKRLERLRAGLEAVLTEAIRLGGSSVSDYVNAAGERGFFQLEHRVYLRTGEPCRVCGSAIRRIVVAGRGTHYCPRCQQ